MAFSGVGADADDVADQAGWRLGFVDLDQLDPAAAREVFDVSGAGDTVIGTLALMVATGADLHAAMRVANHAAGIVVGKLGTATAGPEELLQAIGTGQPA
jgi:bifunctional ADP-heptose synthase (sugar kinase/adenylyltransferase)